MFIDCFLFLRDLLYDEQKIDTGSPDKRRDRDIWNDGDDLAFETVQEQLQFGLIDGHAQVKAMDTVFYRHVKLLSFSCHHIQFLFDF